MRQAFLEKGLEQYERLLEDRRSDQSVKARMADTYRELGLLKSEVGAAAAAAKRPGKSRGTATATCGIESAGR